jgi:hypothetical protein
MAILIHRLLLVITLLISTAYGLKVKSSMNLHPNAILKSIKYENMHVTSALATSSLMIPSIANAADASGSTAVAIPIVISILTIFPFLYYSQQLKPKARTVKQIELDENLKAKDKKLATGKEGVAKATKRK